MVQGIPRNMTVGKRFESRPRYLNLFMRFCRQPTLTFLILKQ